MEKPPKYMVCVDNREEAKVALRLACMKARARRGTVEMVHIVPPADFQTLGAIADRMKEERHREGTHLLKTLAEDAHAAYGVMPNPILREGPTGEEIVAAAMADHDVIMVVVGIGTASKGSGKLSAWLASQLGTNLLVPLLMVPGNLTDEQLLHLI